jgi:hypothetical protein
MMVGKPSISSTFVLVVLARKDFRVPCMFGMGSFRRIVYGRDLLAAFFAGTESPQNVFALPSNFG